MRAKAAGITVVAVDVGAEGGVDATVISNEKQAGALDGKYVVDRLKGKGQIVFTDAAKGVTLYASSSDKALLISTRWNGNARAGFIPTTGPLVLPGIDTIDVTLLGKDIFAINHDTPFYEALDDIASLLKDAKHPPDGRSNRMLEVTEKISHLHYWRYSPESPSH